MQDYIENENARLDREGQFWSKEIVVKIEYKYCPNLTIIDTPGAAPLSPSLRWPCSGLACLPVVALAEARAVGLLLPRSRRRVRRVVRPRRPDLGGPRQAQQRPAAELAPGGADGAHEDGLPRVHHPLPGGLQRLEQRHHAAPGHAGEAPPRCRAHPRCRAPTRCTPSGLSADSSLPARRRRRSLPTSPASPPRQVDPSLTRTVVVSTKLDTRIPQFARPHDVEMFLRPPSRLMEPTMLGGSPFFT